MSRIRTYKTARSVTSRNKYGNRKCTMDGYSFDSVKEMNRYADLKYLLIAGEISDLELQKEYELQPAFRNNQGKMVRPIYYRADFVYKDKDGNTIIEDVKSPATHNNAVYKLKKKMMAYKGLDIREV